MRREELPLGCKTAGSLTEPLIMSADDVYEQRTRNPIEIGHATQEIFT